MNKLKFRAWDKNMKQMIPVYDIDFKKKIINTHSAWRSFSEIVLMQYSGLLDNKDEEIYSGDIIENSYIDNTTLEKKVVRYIVMIKIGSFWANFVEGDMFSVLLSTESYKSKIIGNIYENSELLKRGKYE